MSDKGLKSARIKVGLSLVWFLFTFSMVFWWWIFSLHQLDLMSEVVDAAKYLSLRRMLLWEGAVLVSTIFVGGLGLVVLTFRERRRNEQLRQFFSNYSHDLKTSLTRLRLRTEVLAEKSPSEDVQKLLEETSRLDLQLENSLWLARDTQKLSDEKIKISHIVGSLRGEWPELEIKLHQDAVVLADDLALKSVFRNIFQNAWLHGQAKRVDIRPERQNHSWFITIEDDGRGFTGDFKSLGQQFMRSRHMNGNGLGLFLTHDLVRRMHGQMSFHQVSRGFQLSLVLPAGESS